MSPHPGSGRIPCLAVLLFATLAGSSEGLSAERKQPAARRALSSFDAAVVRRAKEGASLRLMKAECQKILTDFRDREGRTLDENLLTWGMTAADYMRNLPFADGSTLPNCQQAGVMLTTAPGLTPVFVCPARGGALNSRLAQVHDPALAEVMVIHEMLHSLGLGETPPQGFEITERVRERCR